MKKKRIYIDPPDSERCEHNARVGRRFPIEYARCGRRKVRDGYCEQHAKMADERVEAFRKWRAEQVRAP